MDPGGILPPTPAQLAANPNHINGAKPHPPAAAAASAVAFKNREAAVISQTRKHVLPVGLQLDIDRVIEASFVNNYNDGCPVFPAFAPVPAAGALAGTLAAVVALTAEVMVSSLRERVAMWANSGLRPHERVRELLLMSFQTPFYNNILDPPSA